MDVTRPQPVGVEAWCAHSVAPLTESGMAVGALEMEDKADAAGRALAQRGWEG
jgi:hypothetical protein